MCQAAKGKVHRTKEHGEAEGGLVVEPAGLPAPPDGGRTLGLWLPQPPEQPGRAPGSFHLLQITC